MDRVFSLLLLIKDLQDFLSNFQQQQNFVTVYNPRFYIKIYNDIFENKCLNDYIIKSPISERWKIKFNNKEIESKDKIISYDLIKGKPFILNGSALADFEFVRYFDSFIALLNNKTNKIVDKVAIENRLLSMHTLVKGLDGYNSNNLKSLYEQFLNINKANLDYFKTEGLILLNNCKKIDEDYDELIYQPQNIDVIFGIHIPIDFDSNYCKSNRHIIEEQLDLITTFIVDKIYQCKPNDKFKYFNVEYLCFKTFEDNKVCECAIYIDFVYNSLFNLLLFIDFLQTLQYL